MSGLLRLYPRQWRDRYGEEFEELLEQRPPSARHRLDIVRGALDAHLHPQLVDLALDVGDALQRILLARPPRGELVADGLRLRELPLDRLAHRRRLVRHRGQLDLELPHASLVLSGLYLPLVAVAFVAATLTHHRIPREAFRRAVLALCAVSATILLVRSALG